MKLVKKDHPNISVRRQCKLLSVNRSSIYYKENIGKMLKNEELKIKIKTIFLKIPFYGYRKVALQLQKEGQNISKNKVNRLMKEMGIQAIYPKKNLSKPAASFTKYPYLLKGIKIERINQVWESDITYLKINGSNVYLVAIIDVFSRKVLSWNLSNSLAKYSVIEALEVALLKYESPEKFNTDQGSQFTSTEFQRKLKDHNIKISMVGKGRATDNIYIERLWRSLKYEEIYLKDYTSVKDCKISIKKYFDFYNKHRFHQSLEYQTPDEIYYQKKSNSNAA